MMNERIQELAEEATHQGSTTHSLDIPQWYLEKFAELIIQDIITTTLFKARWHQEVERDDNTVKALCDLIKDIREEYGVS